jgi:hypothetical protein
MKLDFSDIVAAAKAAGFTARDYNGRGMYGRYCVAIVVPHVPTAVAKIMAANPAMADELVELFEGTHEDSMGREAVMYWPRVDWVGEIPSTNNKGNEP